MGNVITDFGTSFEVSEEDEKNGVVARTERPGTCARCYSMYCYTLKNDVARTGVVNTRFYCPDCKVRGPQRR